MLYLMSLRQAQEIALRATDVDKGVWTLKKSIISPEVAGMILGYFIADGSKPTVFGFGHDYYQAVSGLGKPPDVIRASEPPILEKGDFVLLGDSDSSHHQSWGLQYLIEVVPKWRLEQTEAGLQALERALACASDERGSLYP